ncbi:MAG: hypothetical protein FD180_3163 [Planctomycetota bacterium]|nr:MAG: hypothetical protein FD180_3163 [Planctomycetota bacterium]
MNAPSTLAGPVESAYVFRHALLRDAAYQLQLPGDRARLHDLALTLIEDLCGGRAPEAAPLDAVAPQPFQPHASDAWAEELVTHAQGAGAAAPRRLYLRRGAEHRERRHQSEAAAVLWLRLAEASDGAARGEATRRAGMAYVHAGFLRLAEPRFQEALALQRAGGWIHFEGLVLGDLGYLLRLTGQMDRSVAHFGEAVERLRQAGSRANELLAIEGQACALMEMGRVDEAELALTKAKAIGLEKGHEGSLGSVQMNMATLYMDTGRRPEAERVYQEALGVLRASGDRRREGVALSNFANLHRDDGRFEEAERLYAEARAIAVETGDRRVEGVLLGQRAALFQSMEQLDRAENGFLDSLSIHREVGNRRFEGIVLGQLANIRLDQKRFEEAGRGLQEAIAIHREVGNPRSEGIGFGNLARLFAETGRVDESLRTFEKALDFHARVGNRRFAGIHGCDRALALLAAGRADEAREAWRKSAATLREIGDTQDLEFAVRAQREACAKAGVAPLDE